MKNGDDEHAVARVYVKSAFIFCLIFRLTCKLKF